MRPFFLLSPMFCLALYLPRAFVSGLGFCITQKPLLVGNFVSEKTPSSSTLAIWV